MIAIQSQIKSVLAKNPCRGGLTSTCQMQGRAYHKKLTKAIFAMVYSFLH